MEVLMKKRTIKKGLANGDKERKAFNTLERYQKYRGKIHILLYLFLISIFVSTIKIVII